MVRCPTILGRTIFSRPLGSGALATVYLAEDAARGTRAVVKVGRPDLDSSAQARFRTEAGALARLQHPNILRLLESGTLPDGRPFLATQWVEGTALEEFLVNGASLSLRDAVLIARSLARALGYAHERHILHLDIKPANILIPKQGETYRFQEAQLLDFSVLGQVLPDTGTTLAGTVVGTPYFMSPEQVRGEALTPAADIFSLGVVLYLMLSHRLPFEGKNAGEMFHALLSKDPPPLWPPVPDRLSDLVMKCLAKDPRQRPTTAAEVESALDALLNVTLVEPVARVSPPPAALPEVSTAHGLEEPSRFVSPDAQPVTNETLVSPTRPDVLPSRPSAPNSRVRVVSAIGFSMVTLVLLLVWMKAPGDLGPIALGSLLVIAGLGAGLAMSQYLGRRKEQAAGEVSALLGGVRSSKALSMTLSLQVDEVIKKCKLMDEKFLGLTMAVMVNEYESARNFDDRQKALMNAIAILDKLGPRLSPWYVRHDKLIATGVSLTGIVSGLATAAQSVAKLMGAKAH